MLTGQYPSRHGSIGLWVPMKRSVDTIAAALRRRGYYTAGSVAVSHIGRAFNFDRGFVDFAQPAEGVTERDANAVNQDALRFLAARPADRNEPFFLFVHYFDCHAPYGWWHGDQTDAATLPVAERIRRYDQSIRHVDDVIRQLYESLSRSGLAENTIFCVTADHGEQIGDHGLASGHAGIYDETTHVPLLFAGPGIPAARIAAPVSSLDIAPSLASVAGATFQQTIDGRSILPKPDGLIDHFLYAVGHPRDLGDRELIVLGNPWYTRAVELISGRYRFIKNFDNVYRYVRVGRSPQVADGKQPRLYELAPVSEMGETRRYVLPTTSYLPFTVTLDYDPKGTNCTGEMTVSMPPGFRYTATPISGLDRTRLQFSAGRFDTFWITVTGPACKGALFYRLDRPTNAPELTQPPKETYLFNIIYAERKYRTSDELYDVEKDPHMLRNLIRDPVMNNLRLQLERRTQDLYGSIYGASFDQRTQTPNVPAEEIEKLKSLGYLLPLKRVAPLHEHLSCAWHQIALVRRCLAKVANADEKNALPVHFVGEEELRGQGTVVVVDCVGGIEGQVVVRLCVLDDGTNEHARVERVLRADALDLRREKAGGGELGGVDLEPADIVGEVDLQVLCRLQRASHIDVGSAAEAAVGEVDVLPQRAAGRDLRDHLIEPEVEVVDELMPLEKLVPAADLVDGQAEAGIRAVPPIRAEAGREEAIEHRTILLGVVL